MLPIYSPIVKEISADNPEFWPIILIFILLVSVTMLNMLIGVLCEIVRQVSITEKEELTITHVTHQLKKVMGEFRGGQGIGFGDVPSGSQYFGGYGSSST